MIESTIYIGDLKHRNGLRRDIRLSVPAETFSTPLINFEDDLTCDFVVESVSQGFVVHGTISGQYGAQCSYGLVDMSSSIQVSVNELFEEAAKYEKRSNEDTDEETYVFSGDEIDAEQLIRDTVLTSLPLAPVCDHGPDNCSICSSQIKPFISKDLPTDAVVGSIEDALGDKDDRWAVLNELDVED